MLLKKVVGLWTWNPDMTSVLIGKDHILGGWWSKIEVIQVLGNCID